jgi:hypothetical protein
VSFDVFSVCSGSASNWSAFRSVKGRKLLSQGYIKMALSGPRVKILIGKPEEKISHGRPTCRWEDNIRMDLREIRSRR